ncbi:MAG: MobA/MobL family protein [Woeseiaceae bacterium]|nr:MobA/MobL family protein [Woeseiaceae bacterium]
MAIYHLSVKLITRGAGRSATAASAYRAADRVNDERTGLVFDYTRKRGVEHAEIVLPSSVAESAEWARDREQLWNAAEVAEKRKDARVAREYEVALPHELKADARLELVRGFAQELADRFSGAVDFAIHAPHREGDTRNHHAHILATTRRVAETGLAAKTDIELKDADRAKRGLSSGRVELTEIRERWASLVNEHLEEHGHEARVDHRTLAAQGEVREPSYHKGPAVTAIERRGERTQVSERIREDITERLSLAAESGRLERESKELARSIVDTTTELKAALAEREAERSRSMDEIRHDARAEWLASRSSGESARSEPTMLMERSLDLSGDMDSARREAREAWLAERMNPPSLPTPEAMEGQGAEPDPPRIILPDDDLTR